MINKRNQNHIQMKSLSLILALLLVLSVFGGCGNKETVSTSCSAADSVTDVRGRLRLPNNWTAPVMI